jgi:hypothetical protein
MKDQNQEHTKKPPRSTHRLRIVFRNPKPPKRTPAPAQGQTGFDFETVEREGNADE